MFDIDLNSAEKLSVIKKVSDLNNSVTNLSFSNIYEVQNHIKEYTKELGIIKKYEKEIDDYYNNLYNYDINYHMIA